MVSRRGAEHTLTIRDAAQPRLVRGHPTTDREQGWVAALACPYRRTKAPSHRLPSGVSTVILKVPILS